MSVAPSDPQRSPPASGSGSDGDSDTVELGRPRSTPSGPTGQSGSAGSGGPVDRSAIGGRFGRYAVLEEIGRGSMGRVLRAYDPKLQREVALKVLRADVFDEVASRRLVSEARAMARLSHPHVVAVYDVETSTPDGLVLAMEYVAGSTLRRWLKDSERPWSSIVGAFVSAGRGLAAAHAAGLLHRDFKPANVLVVADPDAAHGFITVKVTDFGLAKPTATGDSTPFEPPALAEQQRSDELTRTGWVVGTPRYMAPEQHAGETLSPATDQFGFCVALWEALCGAPPFAGHRDKLEGPPPWPREHDAVPRRVRDALRRGLLREPADRFPSMDALLEVLDVDIAAQRARRRVATMGIVAVAVGLGGATYGWAARDAARCSGADDQLVGIWDDATRGAVREAIRSAEAPFGMVVWGRLEAELDAYADEFSALHRDACEATNVRGEQSEAVMDVRMRCLHRAKLDLEATVDVLRESDGGTVARLDQLVDGLPPLDRCADVDALQAEVEPPLPKDAAATEAAIGALARGRALRLAGQIDEARQAVEEAEAILGDVEYGPARTALALARGHVLDASGEFESAESAFQRALALGAQFGQRDAMREAAGNLMYVVGYQRQEPERGLVFVPLAQGLAKGDLRAEADVTGSLGNILQAKGDFVGAEEAARQTMLMREQLAGAGDPSVAMARNNLANALFSQGRLEEAQDEHRRVLEVRVAALGEDHPLTAMTRNNLAGALVKAGRLEEAELEFRRALEIRERVLPPTHPHIAATINNVAIVLDQQGRHDEAIEAFRRALRLKEASLGPDHPDVGRSRNNVAIALDNLERHQEAEVEHRKVVEAWTESLGPEHPDVGMALNNLGYCLVKQGEYEEAEPIYRRALAIRLAALGSDHRDVATTRNWLASVLLERGQVDEALGLAQAAYDVRTTTDVKPSERAQSTFLLARAVGAARPGERARARTLAEQSLAQYTELELPAKVDEVRAWLRAH